MNALAAATVPHFAIDDETPVHDDAIVSLHRRAFGPGRFTRAASLVREKCSSPPDLNAVAQELLTGRLLGSVRQSPVTAGGRRGVMLGPLAVDPDVKGLGIGRALLREAIRRADLFGAGYIILVGDAPYYAPSGFRPVKTGTVRFPAPVDPARILFYDIGGDGQPSGPVLPRLTHFKTDR